MGVFQRNCSIDQAGVSFMKDVSAKIQMSGVFLDESIYPRETIDHKRIAVFEENLRNGFEFDPIEIQVWPDPDNPAKVRYRILDGRYRWGAYAEKSISGLSKTDYLSFLDLYRASQVPVDRLRYPRAVTLNNKKTSRAGLTWFARHASPRKNGTGLETIWTGGTLQNTLKASQIKAQSLPRLSADDPFADLLYGYDMIDLDVDLSNRNQRKIGRMELFDPAVHAASTEKAGENISQNRETRKQIRNQRTPAPKRPDSMELTKDNIGGIIADEIQKKKIDGAKANELLQKLTDLDIDRNQSKKWKNKFSVLESIAVRK